MNKIFVRYVIYIYILHVYIFTFLVDHDMFDSHLGENVSLRMGNIKLEENEIEQGFCFYFVYTC